MHYFIGRNGEQLGPYSENQIRDQLSAGTVSPDDLAWHEGLADWKPVRELFGGEVPPPVPPQPGPARLPAFRSDITREAPPDAPQLADRGKRLVAVLLDGLVNLVAVGPGIAWGLMSFATLAGGSFGPTYEPQNIENLHPERLVLQLAGPILAVLVPLLAVLIVQTWLLTTRGQTVGKMWMRIRIVRTDGSNPGFVHAILLRAFAMQLIGFVPLVGGVVSLIDPFLIFREDRRCLHDLLADTTVIDA